MSRAPATLDIETVRPLVEAALREDIGPGDITTERFVPDPSTAARGVFLAKAPGILAGMPVAALAFRLLDPTVRVEERVEEGGRVHAGAILAEVRGPARALLAGERVALNFLQRLAGVATETRRYVEAVRGTQASIAGTRKTTPGLRALERYAIRVGGGEDHRAGLHDQFLVKDNHWRLLEAAGARIGDLVRAARSSHPGVLVEVEVFDLGQLGAVLDAGVDWVLLDNFEPDLVAEAVRRIRARDPRVRIEASGGMTLDRVPAFARSGVDRISVGALTHSVRSLDISLEIEPPSQPAPPVVG